MSDKNFRTYDLQSQMYALRDPQVGINFHIQDANGAAIMEAMTVRAITALRDIAADASRSKEMRNQCTNEASRLEQELDGND